MSDTEVLTTQVHVTKRTELDSIEEAWCKWQLMESTSHVWTRRLAVQGGWVVHTGRGANHACCFVPDAHHEWDLEVHDVSAEPPEGDDDDES